MEVARRSKPQAFERDRNRVGKQKYLRKKRRKGVQKKKITHLVKIILTLLLKNQKIEIVWSCCQWWSTEVPSTSSLTVKQAEVVEEAVYQNYLIWMTQQLTNTKETKHTFCQKKYIWKRKIDLLLPLKFAICDHTNWWIVLESNRLIYSLRNFFIFLKMFM